MAIDICGHNPPGDGGGGLLCESLVVLTGKLN